MLAETFDKEFPQKVQVCHSAGRALKSLDLRKLCKCGARTIALHSSEHTLSNQVLRLVEMYIMPTSKHSSHVTFTGLSVVGIMTRHPTFVEATAMSFSPESPRTFAMLGTHTCTVTHMIVTRILQMDRVGKNRIQVYTHAR